MENKRPISLNSITFAFKGVIYVTEPTKITFHDREHMERHIQARTNYWSEICGISLETSPSSCETLVMEEVQLVLKHTCEKLGVDYAEAHGDMRHSELVEARRFAIGICYGRKTRKNTIAKALNLNHTSVIYHIKKLQDLRDTDPKYNKTFIEIEDHVLISLAGSFKEDGSGKKINSNENKEILRD